LNDRRGTNKDKKQDDRRGTNKEKKQDDRVIIEKISLTIVIRRVPIFEDINKVLRVAIDRDETSCTRIKSY
jgi:hypothetical protein